LDIPVARGKFSCKNTPKFTVRPELGRTNPKRAKKLKVDFSSKAKGSIVRDFFVTKNTVFAI
jgi:hypothetical protein